MDAAWPQHGIRSFWLYDCLFGIDNLARLAKVAKEYGSQVAGTVFYSKSPVHTNDYFAARAAEIAAVPDVDTVLFYDTVGSLDTCRLRTLVREDRRGGFGQAGGVSL